MVDRDEGVLGRPECSERQKAIEKHYKWIDAEPCLLPMIRVNVEGGGGIPEVARKAAERRLN